MKAVMWSGVNCKYCKAALDFMLDHGIEVEERKAGAPDAPWKVEDILKAVPDAKTVPQIFIDDKYIGGLIEVRRFLQGQV